MDIMFLSKKDSKLLQEACHSRIVDLMQSCNHVCVVLPPEERPAKLMEIYNEMDDINEMIERLRNYE